MFYVRLQITVCSKQLFNDQTHLMGTALLYKKVLKISKNIALRYFVQIYIDYPGEYSLEYLKSDVIIADDNYILI